MSLTTLALTAELPEFGESLTWSQLEAWAVAMREELPAAALAEALEELQDRLIDRVCGPKWLPVRDLPAPFACPGCGAARDFARKGRRTRPRRFDRILRIDAPDARMREAYFARKVPDLTAAELARWVDLTDGLPFAALAEMVISVCCLGNELEEAAELLRSLDAHNPSSAEFAGTPSANGDGE